MASISIKPGIEVLHFGDVDTSGLDLTRETLQAVADALAEHKIAYVKTATGFIRSQDWLEERLSLLHPVIEGRRG
jgi:hypothetical protein